MTDLKLLSFSISSYRSCQNTKLPLQGELTALIGMNGAGKSNILNALLFLRKIKTRRNWRYSSFDTNLDVPRMSRNREEANKTCKINADFIFKGKKIHMKGTITYWTNEQNVDEVSYADIKWNLKEFTGENLWHEIDPMLLFSPEINYLHYKTGKEFFKRVHYHFYDKMFNYFTFIPKKKELADLIVSINGLFTGINYYSASQFSDPSQCPVSIELNENRLGIRSSRTGEHEKFILDLYKSYKQGLSQYKRYLGIVNNEGIGLLQEIGFIEVPIPTSTYKVQAGLQIKTTSKERLLIVPVFTIDNNKLSPNQVSEGTFKTLALLFYLLTDKSKLLLIEEPEVCIHHGLLKSIIELIKQESKNKQIIISTHSDYVLDQLKPENIVLVKKETNKGTTSKSLTKAMSANDYRVLRSYLEDSGNLGDYLKEGGLK